jgi:hypothetical protein
VDSVSKVEWGRFSFKGVQFSNTTNGNCTMNIITEGAIALVEKLPA